jgi:hypothetical protein
VTIHNPIVIKCEGLNRAKGCPHAACFYPKAVDTAGARREALQGSGWMWNIQTGDLCRECSNILLAPLLDQCDPEDESCDDSDSSSAPITALSGLSPELSAAYAASGADTTSRTVDGPVLR